MAYREHFAFGETYHCYTRGIEKRRVFEGVRDYERFLQALYLCNDTKPMRRYEMEGNTHENILKTQRTEPLVSIIAYCLMQNHFHVLLREVKQGGITAFMRKLGTAYTMYFNVKNQRVGNLFVKPFRSKMVSNTGYHLHIPHYIHLNPAEIFEPQWKEGRVHTIHALEEKLRTYAYSSFPEYCGEVRPETVILDMPAIKEWEEKPLSSSELIRDAAEYYAELPW